MFSSVLVFVLAFMLLETPLFAQAGLFVVSPSDGSVCHGGESCTIEWLDDGRYPLLPAIGVATVGLYTGEQKIVQWIKPVDVSTVHSITFTPNPAAGPNSDAYYIAITSTSLTTNDSTIPYTGWSPNFSLDRMSGSFDTPLPSATAPIPVPSSLASAATQSTPPVSTVTVGNHSTSLLPSSPVASATTPTASSSYASKLSTSLSSASSTRASTATSAKSSSTSVAHTSGAAGRPGQFSASACSLFLAAISAIVLCTFL